MPGSLGNIEGVSSPCLIHFFQIPEVSCGSFKEEGDTKVEEEEGKAHEAFITVNFSHLMLQEIVFLAYCQFSRNQQITALPLTWDPAFGHLF